MSLGGLLLSEGMNLRESGRERLGGVEGGTAVKISYIRKKSSVVVQALGVRGRWVS